MKPQESNKVSRLGVGTGSITRGDTRGTDPEVAKSHVWRSLSEEVSILLRPECSTLYQSVINKGMPNATNARSRNKNNNSINDRFYNENMFKLLPSDSVIQFTYFLRMWKAGRQA
jgi:hypothetical protein